MYVYGKRLLLWSVAAVLTSATACAAPARTGPPPVPRLPSPTPGRAAAPGVGLPSVGVLADEDGHWCTASVVDSPRGDVVATAAHCVFTDGAYAEDFSFVPGYRGADPGTRPYGSWKVRAVQVDDGWRDDGDDAVDYAFLTLEPDERGRSVQQVVGGAEADWASPAHRRVTVVGYPNEDHNPSGTPVSCTTDTSPDPELDGSMRMECAGFWDGTSGSPWLADYRDARHPGRLIGVLSGGETDTESTAVVFDARARELYEKAAGA
ncbi:trypsin-like serine peptidase [Streptomyces purpureus]|uniref:Peptidase S1 domain-containing protein n=1 Tax=Streptomyces purpureus TaxID=1951 RepID=A0A918H2B5_9ACTN|nr:trypsin-like serine protease [Streptomyces purpureus]GGT33037.1 hypothetical protein GCM10014713_28200 [Streptomyces purpureus]